MAASQWAKHFGSLEQLESLHVEALSMEAPTPPPAFKALRYLVAEKWQSGSKYPWAVEVEQLLACWKGRQERLFSLKEFHLSESSHLFAASVEDMRDAVWRLKWDGLEGFNDCDEELEGARFESSEDGMEDEEDEWDNEQSEGDVDDPGLGG